ncbi:MAG: hypothetical protein ACXAEN_19150 [Candidatus Thorarchaeota archaeon]|jgi:hypothetical protein
MKFYYPDGTIFEGDWEDAPGWGLQIIEFDDGTPSPALRHQGEYYRMEDGEPVAMDYDSLMYYVVEELKIVKVGHMLGTKRWKELFEEAQANRVR